jgi:hypothetical protein
MFYEDSGTGAYHMTTMRSWSETPQQNQVLGTEDGRSSRGRGPLERLRIRILRSQ